MQLYSYQRAAITQGYQTLQKSLGFYIQHDPGMGKTVDALLLVRLLLAQKTVIECMPVGIGVWVRHVRWLFPRASVCVIQGNRVNVDGAFGLLEQTLPTADFYITNYEQLRPLKGSRRKETHPRLRSLLRLQPDLLVLDEAHMVKGPSSQVTRETQKLNAVSGYRLLLSGTPAHSPLDWWSQHRMIDPTNPLWAQTFTHYRQRVAYLGGPNGQWVKGWREEYRHEALEAIAQHTHVATVDETDWQKPVTSLVSVPLSPAERTTYQTMMQNLFVQNDDWQSTAAITLTKYLRLHEISGGNVHDTQGEIHEIGSSKLDACVQLLAERQHQKVVVACRFSNELRRLRDALRRAGRAVQTIDGSTSVEDRSRIEQEFQRDDGRNTTLLIQYKAGGTSLTLTAARALVVFSMDPSVIAWRQMLGRVWRIGQRAQVQVLYLIGEKTLDQALYDGIQRGLGAVDLARHLRDQRLKAAA